LQTCNTSDACISHCSVLQGDGARWGWGVEGNGSAGDGGTAGDGDATRHGGAVGDRPHAGAHSFYCIGYVHFIYVVALFDEIWTTPIISIGWSRGASGRPGASCIVCDIDY